MVALPAAPLRRSVQPTEAVELFAASDDASLGLSDFNASVVPLADLDQYRDALADLAARAPEGNVFFEPIVLDAAMREVRNPARLSLVMVWEDAGRIVLAGALPLMLEPHHWGPYRRVAFGWKHDCGIRATPLIAPGRARLFWAYALEAIARADLPRYLILPAMAGDGGVFQGLRAAVAASGRHLHVLDDERHIIMSASGDGSEYLRRSMSARSFKRLAKNRRDLEKLGPLENRLYTRPGDVMVAFRQFAELEAAGWKGRDKGAVLMKPDALRFFLRTLCDFAGEGRVRVDSLELNGRPIAMSIVVISGRTAFCWKTTYDEAYAKYSPGMLVVADVTNGLAADPRVAVADSCTAASHPLMSRMWSQTASLVDVLVDTRPQAGDTGFKLAVATERTRRRARAMAKSLYHAARRLLGGNKKN